MACVWNVVFSDYRVIGTFATLLSNQVRSVSDCWYIWVFTIGVVFSELEISTFLYFIHGAVVQHMAKCLPFQVVLCTYLS